MFFFKKNDYLKTVCCKEIVLILDIVEFLNIPQTFIGVRTNVPKYLQMFTEFTQDLKHTIRFIWLLPRKTKPQITQRTFELPRPSHSTEKTLHEKLRKANAESDLCEPERLEIFREPVGNSWLVYLRFGEEIVEVLPPPKKQQGGWVTIGVKKRVRGKMVSRCQRLQRRVFGCFWFRGKPQLLSLKRVDCLMIFITLFKIYIRYDFVSHHCHIVLLLDTIWYNSFQFSIICLLHVRKQHAQIRATFNWRVSTGQPASAFAEKNTFATCSHLCKDSKNQTYILKTY